MRVCALNSWSMGWRACGNGGVVRGLFVVIIVFFFFLFDVSLGFLGFVFVLTGIFVIVYVSVCCTVA